MYGWIWRKLPGSWPVRALLCALAFAAIVAVLFTYAFPAIEPWVNQPSLP